MDFYISQQFLKIKSKKKLMNICFLHEIMPVFKWLMYIRQTDLESGTLHFLRGLRITSYCVSSFIKYIFLKILKLSTFYVWNVYTQLDIFHLKIHCYVTNQQQSYSVVNRPLDCKSDTLDFKSDKKLDNGIPYAIAVMSHINTE